MLVTKVNLARELLEQNAPIGRILSYREFAAALGISKAPVIAACTKILETIMRQDADAQQPMLAALVVQQGLPRIPRQGFFQQLSQLNLYHGQSSGTSAEQWHLKEIEKLKEYYR